MKRILKDEVGRCRYCGSSIVISQFYVGPRGQRRIAYQGCCANKECGHKTAGAYTKAEAIEIVKGWGILASPPI